MLLPESTYETLNALAKSAGIEIAHFCSNVLTDYAADNAKPLTHKLNGESVHIYEKTLQPDKTISEMDLINEIVSILKKHKGSLEKIIVEETVFERNKNEFSQPYWQAPVGGGVPRWQKNTQFARNSACKLGLLKTPEESGRGVWELTEKGWKWKLE